MRQASRIPVATLLVLVSGAALHALPNGASWGTRVWLGGLVLLGAPIVWRTLRGLTAGRFAADVAASLAIVVAVILQEPVAGLIIVLMQSGGEALERYAAGRASMAVRELEAASPRIAHRFAADGTVEDIAVGEVRVGDLLLVRPGELVPSDGAVVSGRSHVDASRLTGEPVPVTATTDTRLMSGSVNVDSPLTVRATALASESQYARIVNLVRAAQESKSPLQRIADRYAVWFTPATLAACAATYFMSSDWTRVLAVLVVATPCPLILATPVAIIGGINRAARRQIIVRSGGALEQLARITVAVFDKTGTLTIGRPRVSAVRSLGAFTQSELLRLTAAVEQGAGHLLARTVVEAATEAALSLPIAEQVFEWPGRGVRGDVEGHRVVVGSQSLIAEMAPGPVGAAESALEAPALTAYVAIDGVLAGTIEFADMVRPGLPLFFSDLKTLGVGRVLLLSGDREVNVRAVGMSVGISEVRGDLHPSDKVDAVRELMAHGGGVLMVGDGTNDAPALSAATVGVAVASHGGGIATEAADVVILADDVTRVADAIRIGRRTMRIARQSIWVGLSLSAIAMVAAAFGLIAPTAGALLQEAIDVAVILNALRASRA